MIVHHIDANHRIITTRVSGRVSVGEVALYLHRLVRDPHFRSDYNSLIVAMDEVAVPQSGSIMALAPLVRAWSVQRAGAKWAFVLPSTATRDLVENAIAEARLRNVFARCFVTEGAAFGWLENAAVPHPAP